MDRCASVRPALVALALLLVAPVALAAGAPVVSAGDFWESRGTFTLATESATVSRRAEIVEIGPVAHAAWSGEAIHTRTVEKIEQARAGRVEIVATTTVDEWAAADGSGTLRAVETLEQRGDSLTTTFEYLAPCKRSPSPLAVGAERRFSCEVDATRNGKTSRIVEAGNATVAREERVTVPAGTFHAFVVVTEQDGCASCEETRWTSPAACRDVKRTSTGSKGETFATELASFRCAKAAVAEADAREAPAPAGFFALAGLAGAAVLVARRGPGSSP